MKNRQLRPKIAKKFVLTAVAASVFAVTNPVQAVNFSFSYILSSGDNLTGEVIGDLQGDGDTIIVSKVVSSEFNLVLGPSLPFVNSVSNAIQGSGIPPTLSLSGSRMDFLAATDRVQTEGFAFDGTGIFYGYPAFVSSPFYGGSFEKYNQANWSMKAVPEPLTILGAMTATGFGVGFKRKLAKTQKNKKDA
jgi:hypothetical protein